MQEQLEEDTSDRTNNFHAYFVRELLSEEELDVHLFFSVVGGYVAQLESQGDLWSRLKQTQPQLFQEILARLQKKREEFDPDYDKWMGLMRSRQFDEADNFDQERQITERQRNFNEGLNPLLNQAFDLLVSWGADPKKLAM